MKKLLLLLLVLLFTGITTVTNAQIWEQTGDDIDGETAGEYLGQSVSLSNDGSIVAIGAYGNNYETGVVRIYQNTGKVWTQIGDDINGEADGDGFGWSVDICSDGSVVAIGAKLNDGNGQTSGHVRIYKNNDGTWIQIGEDIDGEASGDESGYSLSLNSDGSVVAITAGGNDGNGSNSGHARIYKNIDNTWTQLGGDINGEASEDYLGHTISLNSDASIVAVGAGWNSGNGFKSGNVRIYEKIAENWIQIGEDIDGKAAGDKCATVSLSSDGSIVAVGAYGNDDAGIDAGHVRVYENIDGAWEQIGDAIFGEAAGDYSGFSIKMSADGSIVAIGAHKNDNDAGHVRVYQNIDNTWTQIGEDIDGEFTGDGSGISVSLSDDGYTLAIGADKNSQNGYSAGHVRIFNFTPPSRYYNTFEQYFNLSKSNKWNCKYKPCRRYKLN